VNKEKVAAQKYDLSASRYREIEQEEMFYEKPAVTLERMRQLDTLSTGLVVGIEMSLE